ncbi:TetR/AcrR family transcriptional regulator [Actinocrispum wychmicini]|uniref:TetR family transcriptional regulator n=1 Tax=Actinocrispum wychmicini TaxID=1213861 RepID=A0A4R2J6N2_9PSEU|nr:TetR/AcrR family transcriptional regulator [Actinocrispum wychmicini]TCO50835.1 TetR family transcriptional regulator [Actinocrispum wychmicini]
MELPEPPWRSAQRKPARQPLSRDLIVDTALKLLEKEGLDALSMRRVAQALNTGPASLYAHVRNREELCELMFDRILGDIDLPKPDPARWRGQLKDLCLAQVKAMVAYPGIAQVVMNAMIPTGPNSLRHGEAMLGFLRAGGLSERHAAFAFDALGLYCKAFAAEVGIWQSAGVDQTDIADRVRQMVDYMKSLPPGTFPNLLAIGPLFSGDTARDRLEFAIDTFIAGLVGGADGGGVAGVLDAGARE